MRSIIVSLVTNFIGLAYEGISSHLLNKRQETLHKAFVAMENKVNLQHKLFFSFGRHCGHVQYL